jgi:predicted GIY-YIG superfamily endonuclease
METRSRTAPEVSASPHCAYVLATTRCEQYYIDVAPDLEAIGFKLRALNELRRARTGQAPRDPSWLVWHEACASEAAAQARAADIRALPHAWQRRLIQTQNPYWLEQMALELSWPVQWWYVVPETVPLQPAFGPHGIPPERVAQLMAHHHSLDFTDGSWTTSSTGKPARLRLVR